MTNLSTTEFLLIDTLMAPGVYPYKRLRQMLGLNQLSLLNCASKVRKKGFPVRSVRGKGFYLNANEVMVGDG